MSLMASRVYVINNNDNDNINDDDDDNDNDTLFSKKTSIQKRPRQLIEC